MHQASGGILILLLAAAVVIITLLIPLKLAAAAMGAERTGLIACLLALVGASLVHGIGLSVPVYGTVVAFLLSALAFAAILGTGFIRGIGIAVLFMIFSGIITYVLSLILGIRVYRLL